MAKITNRKTTANRRRSGRTKTAELFQLSKNAYKLGRTARLIYGTARISVTPAIWAGIRAISRAAGITASAAARRLLEMADLLDRGKTAEANRKCRYFEVASNKRRRRTTETKADIWARENAGKGIHKCVNLRLTARNLADVATEQAENIENRLINKTYSKALCQLIRIPLGAALNAIKCRIKTDYLGRAVEPAEKPERQKRNRTITEVKRRLKESGCKSSL